MTESVTVVWDWRPAGRVKLAGGKLVFPRVGTSAGVYRLIFQDASGVRTGVYLGEADQLSRRFQHYRMPGPSQQTNLRLNPIMVETLDSGGGVVVEVAMGVQVTAADGSTGPLDLMSKAARVLVERAAEVVERAAGSVVLNK